MNVDYLVQQVSVYNCIMYLYIHFLQENTQRSTLGASYVISKEKTYSVPKKINENAESHSQNLPGI